MGFCLHPSLGKGQVSLPAQRDEAPSAARWVTVCLPFQTEVQILRDEEEDALGKESWGPSWDSCIPHPTSPVSDAGAIGPLSRLMGGTRSSQQCRSQLFPIPMSLLSLQR